MTDYPMDLPELEVETEGINQVQDTLLDVLKTVIDTDMRNIPNVENATKQGLDVETFRDEYATTIVDATETVKERYKNYLNEATNYQRKVGRMRTGDITGDFAKDALDDFKKKDKTIKERIAKCEEKLSTRYSQCVKLSAEANLIPLAAYNEKLTPEKPKIMNTSETTEQQAAKVHTSSGGFRTVLPPSHITLPTFYGDISNWAQFYLIFKELVADVSDEDIKPVMKHNLLINHLRGEAGELIAPYKKDGSEFKLAFNRLVKRYNSSERLYDYYCSRLESLPEAADNPTSLRKLHNELLAITSSLKEYGEIESPLVQRIIKDKLPERILVKCLEKRSTSEGQEKKVTTTSELLSALDDVIDVEESAHRSKNIKTSSILTIKNVRKPPAQPQMTNSDKQKLCRYCNKTNHTSKECKACPTIEERKEMIRNNKWCYNCLRPNHSVKECTRQFCPCGGKHNSSICTKMMNQVSNNPRNVQNTKNFRNQRNQNQQDSRIRRAPSNQYTQQNNQTYGNTTFQPHFRNQGDNQRPTQNQTRNTFQPNNTWQNRAPQRNTTNQQQQRNFNSRNYNQQPNNQNYQNQNRVFHSQQPPSNRAPNEANQNQVNNFSVAAVQSSLMIANAPIITEDRSIEYIPILMDAGADQSFITEEFAKTRNLKVIEENVNVKLQVFGNASADIVTKRVEFEILADHENVIVQALTVPTITDIAHPIKLSSEDIAFLSTHKFNTANITKPNAPVALLSCDIFWKLINNEQKFYTLPSGRQLIPTHIGRVICGRDENTEYTTSIHSLLTKFNDPDDSTETKLEDFMELSNIGITDPIEEASTEAITQGFYETVEINNTGRIVVSLPFKQGQREKLSNNKDVAFCRLKQQFSTNASKETWKELVNNFQMMENTDIIEESTGDQGYFIPYQQVFNQQSNTTKVRTVFDASSKKKGELSLNNVLHQGPSLIPEIHGTLLRIRKGKYLLSGDIEKAFHQVEVNVKDREVLKFLWLKDTSKPPTTCNLRIMQFKRLPFGVNCSPYLLSMAIKYGIEKSDAPEILKKAIETMCYVDNLFLTSDSIDEIKLFYQKSKSHFSGIAMNMREYSVNYDNSFIDEKDRATNTENIKILGYKYDIQKDEMSIKIPALKITNYIHHMTKRQAVSELTVIFDPLQIFAPIYFEPKIIMKELANNNQAWNSFVPPSIISKIKQYRNRISEYKMTFQREVPDNGITSVIVFTDASKDMMGACIYLKHEEPDTGNITVHLMQARQRLTPKTTTMTIPKLELSALLIGIRLLNYTLKEREISKLKSVEIYSDSEIALQQIQNYPTKKSEKQPVFVENRCREIQNTIQRIKNKHPKTNVYFAHVPTDQNPADHITRGCTSEKELYETNWFHGPHWLKDKSDKSNSFISNKYEIVQDPEIETTVTLTKTKTKNKVPSTECDIIPLDRINNFQKAKRIVGYLIRFLKNRILPKLSQRYKTLIAQQIPELTLKEKQYSTGELKALELTKAEEFLIRMNQKTFNIQPDESKNMGLNKTASPPNGIIYQHYRASHMSPKPIIYTKSILAKLIIRDIHKTAFHGGPPTTLGCVLEKYEGIGWRRQVKETLKQCYKCRRMNNHSFPEAPPGQLPLRRTEPSRPFQHVGIDFFGPITVHKPYRYLPRKQYVALITCTASRLIHLELVDDLSTEEFLLALARFMARRGCPDTITSDNAATFKLTSEILKRSLQKKPSYLEEQELEEIYDLEKRHEKWKLNQLEHKLRDKGVKWYFNTALSPWQGGFYERMVGCTKKALKHALGDAAHQQKDLETLLLECENIVNRRPLTYIDELFKREIIRPIDLLVPGFITPEFDTNILENEYNQYTSRFQSVKKQVERFWIIWKREYLQQNKIFKSSNQNPRAYSNLVKPVLGEVVILVDEHKPREDWRLGIISKVLEGRDGMIRGVRVKTISKQLKSTQYVTRPLRLIVPLEIRPMTSDKHTRKAQADRIETAANTIVSRTITSANTTNTNRPVALIDQQIQPPQPRPQPRNRILDLVFPAENMVLLIMMLLLIALPTVHSINPLDQMADGDYETTTPVRTSITSTTTTRPRITSMIPQTTRTPPEPTTIRTTKADTTTRTIPTTIRTTSARFTTTSSPTTTTIQPPKTTKSPRSTTTYPTTTLVLTTTTPVTTRMIRFPTTTTTPRPTIPPTRSSTPSETTDTTRVDTPLQYVDPILHPIASDEFGKLPSFKRSHNDESEKNETPETVTQPRTVIPDPTSQTAPNDMVQVKSKSTITCKDGGVRLTDKEWIANTSYVICVDGYCDYGYAPLSEHTDYKIKAEFMIHEHTVKWRKAIGDKFTTVQQVCPAKDYCTVVNSHTHRCYLCTSFFFNSHCHPKITVSVFIVLMIIPLKLISLFIHRKKFVKLVKSIICCHACKEPIHKSHIEELEMELMEHKSSRTQPSVKTRIKSAKHRLVNRIRKPLARASLPKSRHMIELPHYRTKTFELKQILEDGKRVVKIEKTRSRSPSPSPVSTAVTTITIITVIATLIGLVNSDVCDKTIPISHDEVTCDDKQMCRIEKTEDIFVDPQTETICLQLISDTKVFMKLKVKIVYNFRKCIKGHITYTKNVTVKVDSAKRCHGMGECSGRKCLDIGPNSKLEEFSENNKYLGHTYCSTSCGGLWCWCILPTEGCLFYRTYAIPTTDDLFEIYTCESWTNRITLVTETGMNNNIEKETLMLREGETTGLIYRKHNLTLDIKLSDISEESGLAILGKKFIQSNGKIALAAITNEVFPLECQETKTCTYRETCSCSTAEEAAVCTCQFPDLYKLLDDKDHSLPIITGKYHLATSLDNTPVIKMKHNKFHLQISMNHSYSAHVAVSKIDCTVTKTTPFRGCYNCVKGAHQNVTCKSKEDSHAKLSCDEGEFIDMITCSKKGFENLVYRRFNRSHPTGSCTVKCGTKTNRYDIEGQLTYVEHPKLIEYLNNVIKGEKSITDIHPWHLPDFSGVLSTLKNGTVTIIIALLVFAATAAFMYLCCLPSLIQLFSRRIRR